MIQYSNSNLKLKKYQRKKRKKEKKSERKKEIELSQIDHVDLFILKQERKKERERERGREGITTSRSYERCFFYDCNETIKQEISIKRSKKNKLHGRKEETIETL